MRTRQWRNGAGAILIGFLTSGLAFGASDLTNHPPRLGVIDFQSISLTALAKYLALAIDQPVAVLAAAGIDEWRMQWCSTNPTVTEAVQQLDSQLQKYEWRLAQCGTEHLKIFPLAETWATNCVNHQDVRLEIGQITVGNRAVIWRDAPATLKQIAGSESEIWINTDQIALVRPSDWQRTVNELLAGFRAAGFHRLFIVVSPVIQAPAPYRRRPEDTFGFTNLPPALPPGVTPFRRKVNRATTN